MRITPFLLLVSVLLGSCALPRETSTRWTMLNVTPKEWQADCHLLQFPGRINVLVDAGEAQDAPAGTALDCLKKLGINHFALVVISHFHRDHYGQLVALLQAGITIDRVVLNVPVKESADTEIPWGCDFNDVQAVLAELRARKIPYITPKAGERILEVKTADGFTAGIDVLCCYDGLHSPLGLTDVNDTSIIMRVFHGSTRALFTGDLNHRLGDYLAKSDINLTADLLKAPHHGTENTAPNEFYDRVAAKAVLVPTSKTLWESARSMRIRNYFIEHKTPSFVTGINGNVEVNMTAKGYTIKTEY